MNADSVRDELLALGHRTTPVVVAGDKTIVGYNTSKLSEVLL